MSKLTTKQFLSSTTWTSPSGVSVVFLQGCGGGAGGESAAYGYGRGRGGNPAFISCVPVVITPNTTYSIVIGAGGASDNPGGATVFGSLAQFKGGTLSLRSSSGNNIFRGSTNAGYLQTFNPDYTNATDHSNLGISLPPLQASTAGATGANDGSHYGGTGGGSGFGAGAAGGAGSSTTYGATGGSAVANTGSGGGGGGQGLDAPTQPTTSTTTTTTVGGTADTSWVGAQRSGAVIVGLEEPTWTTGYDRAGNNPHHQALITYLASQGVSSVRILFSWENIQSTAFDVIPSAGYASNTYYPFLKQLVDWCLAAGMYVALCPWQYNPAVADTDITYYGSSFSSATFADFWGKMSALFGYDQKIAFELINEPHVSSGSPMVGISLVNWFAYAQAAINSMRSAGYTGYILVPGMGYASCGNWVSNGSADKFVALTDIYNPKRLIAEGHNYGSAFTTDAHTNLTTNVSATMGVHAKSNGYKFFIGETACSGNPTANPPSSVDVAAWSSWTSWVAANPDTCLGWTWFAVDDNTVAGWGTDFYHWGLTAPGTNNSPSEWMNLIQSSFVNVSYGTGTTTTTTTTITSTSTVPVAPISPLQINSVFQFVTAGITNYCYVPSTYDVTHQTAFPVLIFLHGSGAGNSAGDIYTETLGSNQNYISLAIGGFEGVNWNDNMALGESYVLAGLADLKTKFNVDPRRVIISGYSAGGDLAYRTIFQHSDLFCGIIAENTNPFRDTQVSQSSLLASATWKFNVAHLCHTSDTEYGLAETLTSLQVLIDAGYPVSIVQKAGDHYDADSGSFGTNYDLRTFMLPVYTTAGWVAPGTVLSGTSGTGGGGTGGHNGLGGSGGSGVLNVLWAE